MKRSTLSLLTMVLWAGAAAAQSRPAITLATAEPLASTKITVTGRVQPLICAQIGARVSGTIAAVGTDESNQILDAGTPVKAGQVLFRLDETTFRNTVRAAEAALDLAEANLANLTAPTREERLDQLRQALAELGARMADKQRDEDRYRRLVEEEKTLPAKRLEEVQTELSVLKALRKGAESRLREAENGPTKTEIAVGEARVHEAEAALKTAQSDLRDSTVTAPFDGLITRRMKSPGDYVASAPHTDVMELISLDQLEAQLRVPEAYYSAVQAGKTPVTFHSSLLKGELTLPVGRVVSQIDPATGTFVVRVPIPADQRNGVVPGVFVSAGLAVEPADGGVIVPLRAIVADDGESVVFVAENGRMVRRAVEVSDRMTESAVVRSGLSAGQRVVVGPVEALVDGAPLPAQATRPQ